MSEVLHGVEITDPYRWLEDRDSPRTRQWVEEQARYTRLYFSNIRSRDAIRKRVEEMLSVETCELPRKVRNRYFFRKRAARQEQPSIYMREGADGADQLLVDPAARGTGPYTSVSIFHISMDGKFLVYEIKQGGERSGSFEILDVGRLRRLPESLHRGFLRGFAFAPDNRSFYYVHEVVGAVRPYYRAAYQHVLGTPMREDKEIFFAGEDAQLKLILNADNHRLCFAVTRHGENTVDYYLQTFSSVGPPELIKLGINCSFGLALAEGRIFAMSNQDAPNWRILELFHDTKNKISWRQIVPESKERIESFLVSNGRLLVTYVKNSIIHLVIYDLEGKKLHHAPFPIGGTTVCHLSGSDDQEVFYSHESFTRPPAIFRYVTSTREHLRWAQKDVPFNAIDITSIRVWYSSKDGTQIPMYLVGKEDALKHCLKPTILTGYGGFGMSMTPRFGFLTSFMMERGCLFALANLRGGSEFGEQWHLAAQGRNRQKAFDDFLCAAEWLIENGHTIPEKLAIFGGSNSGLLVGAALTQRPELFRAVLCVGPLMDMLRYHLFDFARKYKLEYGSAEDPEDFLALYAYSPYHRVREGTKYPGVLMVSGDADMNCNPMHARKMIARLQAATASKYPILLDYTALRGHKPVLPLSERIGALTDRLAFLCDQLGVPV